MGGANTFSLTHRSIEKKVKRYIKRNWDNWREKEAIWLTDDLVLSIPKEFIPKKDATTLANAMKANKRKRRSSMGKIVGLEHWNRRQSNFLLPSIRKNSMQEKRPSKLNEVFKESETYSEAKLFDESNGSSQVTSYGGGDGSEGNFPSPLEISRKVVLKK